MIKSFKNLALAILLLTNLVSAAQTSDSLINEFQWSIRKNLQYPNLLKENCISTFTVLKAEIDGNGKVKDIILSDSADPLFNMEFVFIVKKLNTGALEKLALKRKLTSATLLMPIYISIVSEKCARTSIDPDRMSKAFQFNKEDFRTSAIMLPILSSQRIEESIVN